VAAGSERLLRKVKRLLEDPEDPEEPRNPKRRKVEVIVDESDSDESFFTMEMKEEEKEMDVEENVCTTEVEQPTAHDFYIETCPSDSSGDPSVLRRTTVVHKEEHLSPLFISLCAAKTVVNCSANMMIRIMFSLSVCSALWAASGPVVLAVNETETTDSGPPPRGGAPLSLNVTTSSPTTGEPGAPASGPPGQEALRAVVRKILTELEAAKERAVSGRGVCDGA
jgi:hypothetical protein